MTLILSLTALSLLSFIPSSNLIALYSLSTLLSISYLHYPALTTISPMLGADLLSSGLVILSLWIGLVVLINIPPMPLFKSLVHQVIFCLVSCFMSSNLLSFYIFFELVLVPMFLMILLYGNYPERTESGLFSMFYTMVGSIPLLLSVSWVGSNLSLNLWYLTMSGPLPYMSAMAVSIALLIKLPSYGVHVWLPKAHVEAPVEGSSLLAGVLLKLSGYGLYRFWAFASPSVLMSSAMMMMGLYGGVVASFTCLRQSDLKKLVAYSSVVHMGLSLSGMVTYYTLGASGALLSSVGHGLCSSGMFFLVNASYIRLTTRSGLLVSGVGMSLPKMMSWAFLMSAANMAAPPSINFISELSLSSAIMSSFKPLTSLVMISLFLTVAYSSYFYSLINHSESNLSPKEEVLVSEHLTLSLHLTPLLLMVLKLELYNWIG